MGDPDLLCRRRPGRSPVRAERRLSEHLQLADDDLVDLGPLLVHTARLSRHVVLVRGGDPAFDSVTDMRLEVTPDDDPWVAEAALWRR